MNPKQQPPSYIAPDRLYSLKGFMQASGVNATRICHARRRGIDLPCLQVGRRKFVRGADAIAYIERLAAGQPGITGEAIDRLESTPYAA
jgi:hypothetical protein